MPWTDHGRTVRGFMDDKTYKLLLLELERINTALKDLDDEIKDGNKNMSDIKVEIGKIQTKSSVAGSIAGFLSSALVALAVSLFKV